MHGCIDFPKGLSTLQHEPRPCGKTSKANLSLSPVMIPPLLDVAIAHAGYQRRIVTKQ